MTDTPSRSYEPLLEQSIEIDVPPERVWALISDVRRMPEWSPTVRSTRLRPTHDRVVATQFTNLNKQGDLEWTTHGEIVRFTPVQELAFRIEENWVVWSFRVEPTTRGTRLRQQRETPDGISELSLNLTDAYMGGQEAFTATLRSEMRQTLQRIKAAAEG